MYGYISKCKNSDWSWPSRWSVPYLSATESFLDAMWRGFGFSERAHKVCLCVVFSVEKYFFVKHIWDFLDSKMLHNQIPRNWSTALQALFIICMNTKWTLSSHGTQKGQVCPDWGHILGKQFKTTPFRCAIFKEKNVKQNCSWYFLSST